MTDTPQPRRRWYQFSLRMLLLLVALASIPFAWLGYKVREKQRQRESVQAIQRLGGVVFYDYEDPRAGGPGNAAIPPGPAWLRAIFGDDIFAQVQVVTLLPRSPMYDVMYDAAGRRPLDVDISLVTDADLVHLKRHSGIKVLIIGWPITDAGAVHLHELTQLESLYLEDAKVTDAGIAALKEALPILEITQQPSPDIIE